MKRIMWVALGVLFAFGAADSLDAQQARIIAPRALAYGADNPNAARIGVFLGDSDLRDTLGVLVSSVVEDGPAAQAGIKSGDRIVAIDGVNLRMTRLDAEDAMLNGMMNRRLTRTLDAKKPGDEVELRLWSDGTTRTVRVKTVAARDLVQTRERAATALRERITGADRAALGLSLGGTASRRDTLGVLIIGVTTDGPAEKAGLVEGDRIARINDIDLRVPREDAGDAALSRARVSRLTREIGKLKVGDAVTLSVWSGGRQRDVRITTVRAGELRSENLQMFFGDGAFHIMPRLEGLNVTIPRIEIPRIEIPEIDVRTIPRGGVYYYRGGSVEAGIREQVQRSIEEARRVRTRTIDAARRAAEQAQRSADVIRNRVVERRVVTTRQSGDYNGGRAD